MFHLAIESTTRDPGICILEGPDPVACRQVSSDVTSSSGLVPAIADALKSCMIKPSDIGLVSVSAGPGSFTGLRIGVTVAKTLAFAVKASLVAVETHSVIARQGLAALERSGCNPETPVVSIINAQRQQWFVELFQLSGHELRTMVPNRIVGPASFDSLYPTPFWLCGPGLEGSAGELVPHIDGIGRCPPDAWKPRAETVGQLGWFALQSGRCVEAWKLTPCYGRASAAEEKLLAAGRSESL